MPSYVVAGASRGIGLEFVSHLSSNSENTVFALARNPDGAKELQTLGIKANVHVLKADITDPGSLKAAAEAVGNVTGGSLDVLINNGAIAGDYPWTTLDEYPSEEELIADFRKTFDTNVLGAILATNAFLPLLKKGHTKKVLSLSTGLADPAAVFEVGHKYAVAYSITKVGVEMANIKYAAKYKNDGFTFLTISPGIVKTDMNLPPEKPEDLVRLQEVSAQFATIAPPGFAGPISPSESVTAMLKVLDGTTPADSGKFLSGGMSQLAFVEHLSASPEKTVFALVRNPDGARELQALVKDKTNVHIVKGDMTEPASLEAAADAVARLTAGTLDVLINNGAIAGDPWRAIDDYASPQVLIDDFRRVFETNVIGVILTTNAFLPLLRRGALKRVLTLSSGQGDASAVLSTANPYSPSYAVSKTALEMVGVKYAIKYKDEGFTFLTICPGPVKTGMSAAATDPEDARRQNEISAGIAKLAPPGWKGPLKPSESVRAMLAVLERSTPADSGKFLSHKGKRGDWL
ncbi:NAD(P)-binding protein [Auricularia subglabra TFB-10046 SS5]|uniref:NAD(P)-binding protein n=1 Tax=Auricularia subglabra (strain TFB-10046 / SS5) TaxID=717982 RepID=J0LFY5_AURST|nr:NAD(P)-binding protein [Auricularia subglabra TFB-10046 SS5]